jgi:hypothetical protein
MFFKVMSQYSKEKAEKNHEKSEKIWHAALPNFEIWFSGIHTEGIRETPSSWVQNCGTESS